MRFRNAGRVPRAPRAATGAASSPVDDPEGDWTGWVDLPRHDVPADGQVVTANERRGDESDLIGTDVRAAAPRRSGCTRCSAAATT